MCSLVRVLFKKSLWHYFKSVFELVEKSRVYYSFLLVAFYVNIITPASFKDDRSNIIF